MTLFMDKMKDDAETKILAKKFMHYFNKPVN